MDSAGDVRLFAFLWCSFAPTASDAVVAGALGKVDAAKYPNVARYAAHIASFNDAARSKCVPHRVPRLNCRECVHCDGSR